MNILGNIGSWLGKNALELLGLGAGVGTNIWNQHNQNKQNEFNANQAQLNRNFQAEQVQLARDYQTEFYETYQSPSAMVRQYQDAGLNPALMAGGYNPPSAVSTSSASGSAASATSPNYQSMESMVNMIGQMAQLKAEIDNTNADTQLKHANALKLNSDIQLNNKQIEDISQRIRESIARENTEYSKRDLNNVLQVTESIKQSNMSLERYILNFETEYIRKYHRKPDQPALNILLDYLSPYLEVGKEFINDSANVSNKVYNLAKKILGF